MKTDTPMKIPKGAITERKLRKLLKAETDKSSSNAWSAEHKITPQAVSAFERQVQGAGLQIPEALGYKPALIYIPLDEEDLAIKPPPRTNAARKKPAELTTEKKKVRDKNLELHGKAKKKDKKKKKGKGK